MMLQREKVKEIGLENTKVGVSVVAFQKNKWHRQGQKEH